ncbi:hypothetical protein DDB_G0281451 [Dictyostelium discoideum AX4]|uniref:Uncharacterized protein n=1 Tax=Dictyostelium discoideum TaxID=44689 RepID=Q54TX5_DICDI|nr:hypothetical protein DDB_G0281451 [Dictyostelium discoideum AX4]EAL66707.1 hypothetical protein DDB_G0281451 [Dictyostelium discoideum AX4]|eukprot:XP_640686.1 hypothetical protein DDB_G0281451 [Dictyostelium discoideum AX4]
MNFFDKLKGELNLGEEELNKKTIQIRLFYPNTLELNSNSTKLIDNFIVNGTLNIVRRQKGITVFGRILKENSHYYTSVTALSSMKISHCKNSYFTPQDITMSTFTHLQKT